MNKGKFASLIMLGAFVVGVTSSSAVSAQGNKSLAKIVNEDSKSYSDSLDMISKVSDEAISVTNETNVNTEAAINEERKAISKDDSSVAKVDAKNLNGNIEDKTGLLKNLTKVNSKDRDYASVGDIKASEENKAKKIKFAKGAAVVAGSAGAIGSATAVVSALANSFITDVSASETSNTKPTYSPDTESDDTSAKLATDSKSSNTEPTYSPDSACDDTKTEPNTDSKPNNLNQNKKSNNSIKAGIGIIFVIAMLCVYFAICRNIDSNENIISNDVKENTENSNLLKSKKNYENNEVEFLSQHNKSAIDFNLVKKGNYDLNKSQDSLNKGANIYSFKKFDKNKSTTYKKTEESSKNRSASNKDDDKSDKEFLIFSNITNINNLPNDNEKFKESRGNLKSKSIDDKEDKVKLKNNTSKSESDLDGSESLPEYSSNILMTDENGNKISAIEKDNDDHGNYHKIFNGSFYNKADFDRFDRELGNASDLNLNLEEVLDKINKDENENKIVNKKDYNFFKEKLSGLNKNGINNLKIIVNKLDDSGCDSFENFIIYLENDFLINLVECINKLYKNGPTNFAELIMSVDYKNLSKIISLTNFEYLSYIINILDNENGIHNFAKLIKFVYNFSDVWLELLIDTCGQKGNGLTNLAKFIGIFKSNCINSLGKLISNLLDEYDDDNNFIVNLATYISSLSDIGLNKLASLISILDEDGLDKLIVRINNLKEEKDFIPFAENISNLDINNKDDVDNFLKNEELNILNDGSLIQNYE